MKEFKIEPMTKEQAESEIGKLTSQFIQEFAKLSQNAENTSKDISISTVHALAYLAAAHLVGTSMADFQFFNKNPVKQYDQHLVDFAGLVSTYAARMFEMEALMSAPPTGAAN